VTYIRDICKRMFDRPIGSAHKGSNETPNGDAPMFNVTKTFLTGNLKGLTIVDRSPVSFEVGKTYGGGWTGPRYRVDACKVA